PICDLRQERRVGDSLNNRKSTILNLQLVRRVPPGECSLTSSDGDPGTNGVISKTRCGAWNKDDSDDFASGAFGVRGGCLRFENGDMSSFSKSCHHCSMRSSGNSFVSFTDCGKCLANTFPIPLTASTSASLNFSL